MLANLFGGDGLIVLVVALVVLVGGAQLPKIARNVGLAGKEFRKAQQEAEEDSRSGSSKSGVTPPPVELGTVSQPVVAQVPPTQGPVAQGPVAQGPVAQGPATQPAGGEAGITMTPAQLDELLKAHEARVRGESNNN